LELISASSFLQLIDLKCLHPDGFTLFGELVSQILLWIWEPVPILAVTCKVTVI
jgi:hypothetical protein